MKLYRIARADRAPTALAAFSGDGAAKYPGRWNQRGVRAVYCSDSLACACLETLAHIRPLPRRFPPSVYYSVEIPDELLERRGVGMLPSAWQSATIPNETRAFGSEFLDSRRAVALVVPTVLIPEGYTALINPFHPRFSVESVIGPAPFWYDERLE